MVNEPISRPNEWRILTLLPGKRRNWISLVLGLIAAILLARIFHDPPEPVYEGRALSQWVADLAPQPRGGINTNSIPHQLIVDSLNQTQLVAYRAVAAIGPAAIPFLRKDFEAGSGLTDRWFEWLNRRQNFYKIPLLRKDAARLRAALALNALGPAALPALPAASHWLTNYSTVTAGAAVLGGIGPDGLPALRAALKDNSSWTRMCAVWGLAQMRSNASPTLPELISIAMTNNSNDNLCLLWALPTIGARYDQMEPIFKRELQQTNSVYIYDSVLRELENYKSQARPLVPLIQSLLSNTSASTQWAATNALKKIDPNALKAIK